MTNLGHNPLLDYEAAELDKAADEAEGRELPWLRAAVNSLLAARAKRAGAHVAAGDPAAVSVVQDPSATPSARESTDEFFLSVAALAATRSSCVKRQVGAVLVRDKHILGTGYNGVPRNAPRRTTETCVRIGIPTGTQQDKVCCAHAESNALVQAAYHGIRVQGATLYVTTQPCAGCARLIINAGVVRVVFASAYADADSARVFAESAVPCVALVSSAKFVRADKLAQWLRTSAAADGLGSADEAAAAVLHYAANGG